MKHRNLAEDEQIARKERIGVRIAAILIITGLFLWMKFGRKKK
jgi:uncharacterized membrane protein